MQVETPLPTHWSEWAQGHWGREPMGRAWPYNWTCNFKYLSTCSTWHAQSKSPGAVTSCPDAGRFYLPGLPRYPR